MKEHFHFLLASGLLAFACFGCGNNDESNDIEETSPPPVEQPQVELPPVIQPEPKIEMTDTVHADLDSIVERASQMDVIWDNSVLQLSQPNPALNFYLEKLFDTRQIKEISQVELIDLLNVTLKSPYEPVREQAKTLCLQIVDPVVILRVLTEQRLRNPEHRLVGLEQLLLMKAAPRDELRADAQELMGRLAFSYIANPIPEHANELDKVVVQLDDWEGRHSKQYVWFLASTTFCGSDEGYKRFYELYTKPATDDQFEVMLYLHQAAVGRLRHFNRLAGSLIASRAGENPKVILERSIGNLKAAFHPIDPFTAPDLNDFFVGWFAGVDPSYSKPAWEAYKRIRGLKGPEEIEGNDALFVGFETWRLGAISLIYRHLLKDKDDLPVGWFPRQSERVVVLRTMQEMEKLANVQVDSLVNLVEKPKEGTIDYQGMIFGSPQRDIRFSDWLCFVDSLEKVDLQRCIEVLERIVMGQTELQSALPSQSQREEESFPFRIHAMRRLSHLSPASFGKLLAYAQEVKEVIPEVQEDARAVKEAVQEEKEVTPTAKCPGTLQLALLCVIAAQFEEMEKVLLKAIPKEMPKPNDTSSNEQQSHYIEGMLTAFEVHRSGKPAHDEVKLESRETVQGYAGVAACIDDPELAKSAEVAMIYKKNYIDHARIDRVAIDRKGDMLTPFFFMDEQQLSESLARTRMEVEPVTVQRYLDWQEKTFSPTEVELPPKTAAENRTRFGLANQWLREDLLHTNQPPRPAGFMNPAKAFENAPSLENARNVLENWDNTKLDLIVEAFQFLHRQGDDPSGRARFITNVATGPHRFDRSFEREINPVVIFRHRAELLSRLFEEIQELEEELHEAGSSENFVPQVTKFIDDANKFFLVHQPRSRSAE